MKHQFQQFFNNDYTDFTSFLNEILFPIFGENNFDKGYDVLTQDPEIQQKAAEANIIEIKHIGTFSTDLAADIKLFEVVLSDNSRIERSRINIQQLIRRYVETFEGAFMVFHYKNPENRSWRFSYVEKRSSLTDSTSAKRYTYLFGKDYACRTAAQRFNDLYRLQQNITLQNITDAFSVEALSDEFFERYRNIYADFIEFISGKRFEKEKGKWVEKVKNEPDPQFQTAFASNDKAVRDYVKKMLGRLVFLQFLQKKGWMGVPADKSWGEGDNNYMQKLFATSNHKENFLETVLEPLFFDTLNHERDNQIADSSLGENIKIPYLNGGLFEQDELDKKKVVFTANYFKQLFDFFGEYNFTIDENDPNDAELGVDPEMLGRIFENLLEDNKDKGAFYTPKEIVQYMCRESLIAYLTVGNEANEDSIKELVLHHKADSLSDTLKEVLDQKLKDLKVCDPAIGSGAFPMGMMNEIFKCRIAIEGITDNAADIKKHIIQNNIFGVDIENGAVDIARLRFWLALVVEEDVPQALPNLDYKIMCGNSLISRFPLDCDINDVFVQYNKTEEGKKEPLTLQRYKDEVANYTVEHSEKTTQKRRIEAIKRTFKMYLSIDRGRTQIKKLAKKVVSYDGLFGKQKIDLKDAKLKEAYDKNEELKTQIANLQNQQQEILNNKLYENSFEWRFEFPSLLDEVGNFTGFDIVIGNPPYGVSIKDDYRKKVESVLGKVPDYEIYYYFIEIANQILKPNGIKSFIIPNTFLFNVYASNYRKGLIKEWRINCILDCTSFKIFDGATVYNAITIFQKDNSQDCKSIGYKLTRGVDNFLQLSKGETIYVSKESLLENNQNWALVFKLRTEVLNSISKIRKNGIKLSDLFPDISQGLIAYDKYQGQSNEIIKSRAYHFKEKVKPELKNWLWGEDITKFSVKWNGKEWIDYCDGIANPRNPKFFSGLRLLVREITNPSIFCAITNEEFYHDPAIIVIKDSGKGIKCVCAILNSKLSSYYHFNSSPKATKGAFPKILVQDIKDFPLPNISYLQEKTINTLVDFILFLHKLDNWPINEFVPNSYIIQLFEEVVDACVYELYFEEEIKAAQVDVLELIGQSLQKVSSLPVEQQILNLYDEWSEYKNEVRNRIILQETRSESVAIIVNSINL